jgi:hypothetical protein
VTLSRIWSAVLSTKRPRVLVPGVDPRWIEAVASPTEREVWVSLASAYDEDSTSPAGLVAASR